MATQLSGWRTSNIGTVVHAMPIRSLSNRTSRTVGGIPAGYRSSAGSSSSSGSNSSDAASLHRTALELASRQLDGDLRRMNAASGYRRVESDQAFGHRTREADQSYGHQRGLSDQSHGHRMVEEARVFDHRLQENNQMSDLRMREGNQQFGFQRTLQKDNNDVRQAMQEKQFGQERGMFQMKDEAQARAVSLAAQRAARTFRGNF